MVSSRLTPCIKCNNCNNVSNIVVQTPTEQLLSFMEIIPTPASPASINADSTTTNNNLNHAILKLKNLAIEPSNDLFFKKTIICSKCAKFMATEYSYHNMNEPGMNAVISAIQEASKKTNIEILKGDNLYEDLVNQIKANEQNKMLYFILPYEDITPLLKLNETAENQKINLIIENLVSPSEETSPFTSNNQPQQQPSPTTPKSATQSKTLSKLNTKDLSSEENKDKKEQTTIQQHLFVSVKI